MKNVPFRHTCGQQNPRFCGCKEIVQTKTGRKELFVNVFPNRATRRRTKLILHRQNQKKWVAMKERIDKLEAAARREANRRRELLS